MAVCATPVADTTASVALLLIPTPGVERNTMLVCEMDNTVREHDEALDVPTCKTAPEPVATLSVEGAPKMLSPKAAHE